MKIMITVDDKFKNVFQIYETLDFLIEQEYDSILLGDCPDEIISAMRIYDRQRKVMITGLSETFKRDLKCINDYFFEYQEPDIVLGFEPHRLFRKSKFSKRIRLLCQLNDTPFTMFYEERIK